MKYLLLFCFAFGCFLIGCESSEMGPDLISQVEGTYTINEVRDNGRLIPQTNARLNITRVSKSLNQARFGIQYTSSRLTTSMDTTNSYSFEVNLKADKDSIFFYSINNTSSPIMARWGSNIINCTVSKNSGKVNFTAVE